MNSIDEVKKIFDSFICVPLCELSDSDNKLASFSSTFRKNTLDGYLKNEAKYDDEAGKTCVYTILEPENQKIVCFFSLRCGAVFDTHEEDDALRELDTDELRLLKELEKARNTDITTYGQMCQFYRKEHPKGDMIIKIVERKATRIKDETSSSCIDVMNSHPSIEIQHFCRCDAHIYTLPEEIKQFPLGFGLFWQQIVPKIKEISKLIGCEYLYLFAADKSDDDEKHLVKHYVDDLRFNPAEDLGLTIARPEDDQNCWSLIQRINCLDIECEIAWNTVADISDDWD